MVPIIQSPIVSFLVFERPRGLKPAAHQSEKSSRTRCRTPPAPDQKRSAGNTAATHALRSRSSFILSPPPFNWLCCYCLGQVDAFGRPYAG